MSAMRDGEMPIGEVAQQTGLTTATINFYVREGIVPPPRKLNRTRAAYNQQHLRWLRVVKRSTASGIPLAVDRFTTRSQRRCCWLYAARVRLSLRGGGTMPSLT